MPTKKQYIDIIARDKTKKGINRVQRGMKSLTRSVFSLRSAIVGLGVGLLIRNIINTGREIESLRLKFKFLFGSVEEGNRAFNELVNFAGKVPFSLEQIALASGNLAIVSKNATELRENLEIAGNVAAVTGIDFRTTGEQIQRAFGAGIASADIFREKGVRAMLGFQAGVTVSIDETRKRFKEVFGKGGRFGDATKEFATTFEGTMSMITDKIFLFKKEMIEEGFWEELKTQLGDLDDFLNQNEVRLRAIATIIGKGVADALLKLGDALENVDWDKFKIQAKAVISVLLLAFGPAGIVAGGAVALSNLDDIWRRLFSKKPPAEGMRLMTEEILVMERNTKQILQEINDEFERVHGFASHLVVWEKYKTKIDGAKKALKAHGITIVTQADALQKYHDALSNIQTLLDEGIITLDQYQVHRAKITKELGKSLAMTNKSTEALDKENDTLKQAIRFGEEMGTTFSSAFEDAVVSGGKFRDVLQGIYKDILRITLRYTVTEPIGKAFSGFISSAAGSLFGGTRAEGGPVTAGRSYVVGERGPELFTPRGSGQIVPNDGGSSVVQNINVSVGVQETVRAELLALMPMIKQASVDAVLEERGRGGKMAQAMGAITQST